MNAAASSGQVVLVMPFYNEAARLDAPRLRALCRGPLILVLVDDGSTDDTYGKLVGCATGTPSVVLKCESNVGKAEAVRRGMLHAIATGPLTVGYADGDLATPTCELLRLASLAQKSSADALLGARVRLASRDIRRRPLRHYLGRFVATYLELRFSLSVYDTQCGAKFFRVAPSLLASLQTPFATRWLFDVELLLRLRREHQRRGTEILVREEPLEVWSDVPGSSIRGPELLRVIDDFKNLECARHAHLL